MYFRLPGGGRSFHRRVQRGGALGFLLNGIAVTRERHPRKEWDLTVTADVAYRPHLPAVRTAHLGWLAACRCGWAGRAQHGQREAAEHEHQEHRSAALRLAAAQRARRLRTVPVSPFDPSPVSAS
jgi:hypothetical protein